MEETQIKPSYQEFLITLARRLRRGSGRPLVEDEANQALEATHNPLGRVDGSEVKSALTEG